MFEPLPPAKAATDLVLLRVHVGWPYLVGLEGGIWGWSHSWWPHPPVQDARVDPAPMGVHRLAPSIPREVRL